MCPLTLPLLHTFTSLQTAINANFNVDLLFSLEGAGKSAVVAAIIAVFPFHPLHTLLHTLPIHYLSINLTAFLHYAPGQGQR